MNGNGSFNHLKEKRMQTHGPPHTGTPCLNIGNRNHQTDHAGPDNGL